MQKFYEIHRTSTSNYRERIFCKTLENRLNERPRGVFTHFKVKKKSVKTFLSVASENNGAFRCFVAITVPLNRGRICH